MTESESMDWIERLAAEPNPIRKLFLKSIKSLELGGYEQRVQLGAVPRPNYAYCVYNAARLAKRLRYPRISVIELGVAGGNGLVELERHAMSVSALMNIGIDVYGFDTGEGLPAPNDYRDLPYQWKPGFFEMDKTKLESRLKQAQLILGDVENTIPKFMADSGSAPIGAVMCDLDLYTATCHALTMFDHEETSRLPRVFCYFDDILGDDITLYNDFTGERLAIEEFNESHGSMKISPAYYLLARKVVESWYHQLFILHDFQHSRYSEFVADDAQQLPLT